MELKRKKECTLNNNFNAKQFAEIWHNKRTRSVIYLLGWLIFIIVLFVEFVIPYEKNQANNSASDNTVIVDEEDNDDVYFEDLKNSLLRYNFNYVYTVNDLSGKTIYKGTMLGNETSGYKESSLGIEKYYLNGMQIYKEVLGERVLMSSQSVDVYNGYLSVDKIMELIVDKQYMKNENQYDFQIEEVYVKISVENDNINKIEITDGDSTYTLEFSNVNEIKELNY